MNLLLAIVIGALYSAGFYLILRRSIVKLIIGLSFLSHASNLLVFAAGGLTRGRAPLVPPGSLAPVPPYADPLPQALVLTAIVISFGVTAFALALVNRTYQTTGQEDIDELRRTEC